jgi:hypothetical protein
MLPLQLLHLDAELGHIFWIADKPGMRLSAPDELERAKRVLCLRELVGRKARIVFMFQSAGYSLTA